jgi:signal transduction histidine kinase
LGKTLIRKELFEKNGPLTADEWMAMQQHPALGAEVIKRMPGMTAVARCVRSHHERYDGRGYPDGLSGDEIPIGARIITVVDSFDAMIATRPYRSALSENEALDQIAAEAGTQFDPRAAEALLALAQPGMQEQPGESIAPLRGALALAGVGGALFSPGPMSARTLGDASVEFVARSVFEVAPSASPPRSSPHHTLPQQLVAAQEAERRRIARELHDEVGQALTGLKFVLEAVPQLPDQKVGTHLRAAQDTINDLMTRIHNLSLDLRPAMLDDLGLLPALLWHFERYTARTGVQVAFRHTGLERRLPPTVEIAAYRMVQEALTNVARHSGAREAVVRVWADKRTLCAQIEDRGQGFDPRGLGVAGVAGGLAGMRERAMLLKGDLTVESSPEGGTKLTAEFPLDEEMRTLH